jgi:hypothetical protein
MKYKKNIFLLLYSLAVITLSGCGFDKELDESFNQTISDFDALFDDTPEASTAPQPIFKAIPNEKPIALLAKNYTNVKKPPIKKMPLKAAVKKSYPKKRIALPQCRQSLFLAQKNISNIYKTYLTHKKSCHAITDLKVKKHFITLLSQYYTSQEVRILNADKDFLTFYTTAIKNTAKPEKIILNNQIIEYGCHLLKPHTCIIIRKSLY